MGRSLKCVFAASEVAGFAKTGGLADVLATLPKALADLGHECIVVMPMYRTIRLGDKTPEATNLMVHIPIRNHIVTGHIWKAKLPNSEVPVYMVGCAQYFERDDPNHGTTFYQYTTPSGKKVDYEDNCERFTFFSRAVLEVIRLVDFWPDILHCNDWHTGLTPVYLREVYNRHPAESLRPMYDQIRSLFTIHNIAFQGVFEHHNLPITNLPWVLFNHHQLEFYGRLNCLKSGIVFSDAITAVSPTYAKEIQTASYGCGLEGVLHEHRNRLKGIVNGVDYDIWNPDTDKHLAQKYKVETVTQGKLACKFALQAKMVLPVAPRTPLIGMVSRLTSQKGFDLVVDCGSELLQGDVQLVILGDGDQLYKDELVKLQKAHPTKVALKFAYDEELAHQIEAGADMFLMPSLFEPCGLNQMYSLKYGTVPIVRKTGGLADTVVDASPENVQNGSATGFMFTLPTPLALMGALQRALGCYNNQPEKWLGIMQTGMNQDWSWQKSAKQYANLYLEVIEAPRPKQLRIPQRPT
ncbi:MAG: glycogen synthase GlgA [Gemmataceae bacterium]